VGCQFLASGVIAGGWLAHLEWLGTSVLAAVHNEGENGAPAGPSAFIFACH